MKKIATLLTVHNRKEKTIKCLKKLLEQEIPEGYTLRIHLTDDGCTDGTAEAIHTNFPGKVNIIHGDGNLFWNRGMWTAWNCAVKEGQQDYYLWLNDDTDLYQGALKALIETSNKYQNKAIIVGATVDTSSHSIMTYGGRLFDGSIPECKGIDKEVVHFNGNIVMIPDNVYQVLGNLDSYFSHSKGDFDYGLRAGKANIKMIQCGSVLGECDTHPSIDKWCDPKVPFSKRLKILNRPNGMPPRETFYFNMKHSGIITASLSYITIYLRCLFPKLWLALGKK